MELLLKGHKIGMVCFGGQFLVQGFFGVLPEALGIFLGLDFWLHSIIPFTWNPEYPTWDNTPALQAILEHELIL